MVLRCCCCSCKIKGVKNKEDRCVHCFCRFGAAAFGIVRTSCRETRWQRVLCHILQYPSANTRQRGFNFRDDRAPSNRLKRRKNACYDITVRPKTRHAPPYRHHQLQYLLPCLLGQKISLQSIKTITAAYAKQNKK